VGIQEKTAFVVAGKKISGGQLYQPIVSIPATIELLLVRTRFRTQYIVNVLSGEQHDASHSTVRVLQRLERCHKCFLEEALRQSCSTGC